MRQNIVERTVFKILTRKRSIVCIGIQKKYSILAGAPVKTGNKVGGKYSAADTTILTADPSFVQDCIGLPG